MKFAQNYQPEDFGATNFKVGFVDRREVAELAHEIFNDNINFIRQGKFFDLKTCAGNETNEISFGNRIDDEIFIVKQNALQIRANASAYTPSRTFASCRPIIFPSIAPRISQAPSFPRAANELRRRSAMPIRMKNAPQIIAVNKMIAKNFFATTAAF